MPNHVNDLSQVCAPIEQAHGLPNAHYVDPHVSEEETRAVIFDQWAGLGTGSDVPEPGDAKPVTFFGVPLLLLRGRDGIVRVFQNICRHRGMILISEPRKIEGAIRCPYHSWCYGTDGRLVSTPHVGGPGQNTHEGIDKDTLGLNEVRSHLWRDVVWINFSGNAAPFEQAMSAAITRWSEFDAPLYHGGAESAFCLEVQSNWKLAVENYCESYHLPWVHPGLNSYSRLEDHYHIEEKGSFSGQGTLVYRQLKSAQNTVFPDFADLSEKWNTAAEYLAVYPNVLLGVHRDHAFSIILLADAVDKTTEHVNIYYATPNTDESLRRSNAALWREVFEEDIFVVEGMQRGRKAPGFDGGRFSPAMDGPTHLFHNWIAAQLLSQRAQSDAAE